MKKMMMLLMVVSTLLLTACSDVPSGYVGIKVYMLGGEKGVDTEELGTGRYWIGFNEQLYTFPTFTQTHAWTKSATEGSPTDESIDFQSKNGMNINTDIGISYNIRPDKVSLIFQTYRKGIDEITHIYLRNMVRDALVSQASKLTDEEIYGEKKEALIKAVEQEVINETKDLGINVQKVYLVGAMRLPSNVIEAINAKVGAIQVAAQKQNEIVSAEAEAKKKVAMAEGEAESILTVARAQAEANKLISSSLTDPLVAYRKIEKWDGKLPTFTGNATPMINITQ
ncbi:MAG: prohibitin family protein [Flavobacterium sp.]|uniref:prohibitin family protein n=1 Tax=Flavobacterium sp. TaxID=239 RepID=UPI002603F1FE|nr:prohibitin family protein [Flavobacterium sp.]MDD5152027.1 prohibitin family protein [Flavobacterium sp.]